MLKSDTIKWFFNTVLTMIIVAVMIWLAIAVYFVYKIVCTDELEYIVSNYLNGEQDRGIIEVV